MTIRIRDKARFSPDRLTKVPLATTERVQLDLYCVAPGQSQAAHVHEAQDKIYIVLEGAGRFTLGTSQDRLEAGDAVLAPAGVAHGLANEGPAPLLVLVVLSPPPPHGPPRAPVSAP